MGRIFTIAFVIAMTLALLLGLVSMLARSQWRAVTVEVALSLMPGQNAPARSNLTCYWHYYNYNDTVYCTVRSNSSVTVGYRTSDDRILTTWKFLEGITIGDLVLAWGEPVGVSGGRVVWYVHFAGGRAAFIGSPYRSSSRVWFVRYEDPAQVGRVDKWRGFVDGDS